MDIDTRNQNDLYILKNPFDYDFNFEFNSEPYTIPANGHVVLALGIAKLGAFKIAERHIRNTQGPLAVNNQKIMDDFTNTILKQVDVSSIVEKQVNEEAFEGVNEESDEELEVEVSSEDEDLESKTNVQLIEILKDLDPTTTLTKKNKKAEIIEAIRISY